MALAFFEYCHRQPLWIFEDFEEINDACHHLELLLPMMALTSKIAPDLIDQRGIETIECFADSARQTLLSTIAEGKVTLATVQGLCLLSFYNFTGTLCTSARRLCDD